MSASEKISDNDTHRYHLDLSRSRSPRAFRGKENLWEDDLERLYNLVTRQIDNIDEIENEAKREFREPRQDDWPHLSIAIFGPSGSGKSSLLRTLADDVGRKYGGTWKRTGKGKKIQALPVMDPTTWTENDQFLYAFLAAALEAERRHQDKKEHGPAQGLSRVQLAFQEVNEYLRVVDDPGTPGEHDPLGQSLQKLERHTSGLRLRNALGTFVEQLSKELQADVILLPVDDLDMAPKHLINSLQTYQSYLTHAQLIPIFTFTDRLPEELIEVDYSRLLKEKTRRRPAHAGTNRLNISETLAVQFLARCFPVRNRIRLGPAPGRVQRAIFNVPRRSHGRRHTDKSNNEEAEVLSVLELLILSSFLLFGHPDDEDAHKVRAALRPSTLRRQFQVVDAMSDCHLNKFHIPQIAKMADPSLTAQNLADLASHERAPLEKEHLEDFKSFKDLWRSGEGFLKIGEAKGYRTLIFHLRHLNMGASWANIFNGAVWSLLNVHRDTLRELGLFLEDLYSWTPKELRSVVLNNILDRDRIVRRTVVDRWFNRTDYRRSQVLSLLAANVFRPWMPGEEPYGDDEPALRVRLKQEKKFPRGGKNFLDQKFDGSSNDPEGQAEAIAERLSIPSRKGFLWFLNVTLGFYLPQVLARDWSSAMSSEEPVRGRMGGNGWDLYHAPINAIRIADARQEIFSFGIMFLDPRSHRKALEDSEKSASPKESSKKGSGKYQGKESTSGSLLLRIWTYYGYSQGRFWSAVSLWRGLSLIGQVLELGEKHHEIISDQASNAQNPEEAAKKCSNSWRNLQNDLQRLIRSHCLAGLVPGPLLDRTKSEKRLYQGFPRWDASVFEQAIEDLTAELIRWLASIWDDMIFPLPAGKVEILWSDCFLRRIHGEYILGSLWPRMNAAYLEQHERYEKFQSMARSRSCDSSACRDDNPDEDPNAEEEKYFWTGALGIAAWSDLLLEYWRGCPPILKLLLTCPVFMKSETRFGEIPSEDTVKKSRSSTVDLEQQASQVFEYLISPKNKKPDITTLSEKSKHRLQWLERLRIPEGTWEDILEKGEGESGVYRLKNSCFVTTDFAVERVRIIDFST